MQKDCFLRAVGVAVLVAAVVGGFIVLSMIPNSPF
jgi:hypothetical protein